MTNRLIDSKAYYLIKSLSRTNRKDYENYVINAVWHKLSNTNIEVVSQQFVKDSATANGRSHYFIDLYFPALNIGIECDEPYHYEQSQLKKDFSREVTIFDILYGIKEDNYEAIHIKVAGGINEINVDIDKAVEKIRQRIQEINPPEWKFQSAEEYFLDRKDISIDDRIGFRSINKVCNILFNAGRKETTGGATLSYFSLPKFSGTILEDHKLWFPKLAILIKDDNGVMKPIAATPSGWNNQLVDDGNIISEINENNQPSPKAKDGKKRIVFLKYKDALGINEYKFMGIFEFLKQVEGKNFYRKSNSICALLF